MDRTETPPYHEYALWLARRYYGTIPGWDRSDYYQTAAIGLLELWRTDPDAPRNLCRLAMRRAIYEEMRRAKRAKREADLVPIEEARHVAGEIDPEQEAVAGKMVQMVLDLVDQLPDNEFRMVGLRLMGLDLRQVARDEGWDEARARRILKRARERLRIWLDAIEVTA